MGDRICRPSLAVLMLMLAGALTGGQTALASFYTPPVLEKMGESSVDAASAGQVIVQVFVHRDGSVGSVRIQKSSNHNLDALALDLAKRSTFRPGRSDGNPIDAYYTFDLKFKGTTVAKGDPAGVVRDANKLVRSGKYEDARKRLRSYLSGHPEDKEAQAFLGVAEFYLHHLSASVAAFDRAGVLPARLRLAAAGAYSAAAVDALKEKKNDETIRLSSQALALNVDVNALYIRGTAYANAQRYSEAATDLEKAKEQALAGSADTATLNAIDGALVTTYLFSGQADKGLALARALKGRDPSNTRIDDALSAYYNTRAVAAMKAGNSSEAVSDLEDGAVAVPSRAVTLYVQAANVLSQGSHPDWDAVKAETDKALAINPNDAKANYVAAIALANGGHKSEAVPYLEKAKAHAGSDAELHAQIDAALTKLK